MDSDIMIYNVLQTIEDQVVFLKPFASMEGCINYFMQIENTVSVEVVEKPIATYPGDYNIIVISRHKFKKSETIIYDLYAVYLDKLGD